MRWWSRTTKRQTICCWKRLRLGNEQEKTVALKALLTRGTLRGMSGLIEQFEGLPDALRLQILREIRRIQPALGEYARHADTSRRLQAMR